MKRLAFGLLLTATAWAQTPLPSPFIGGGGGGGGTPGGSDTQCQYNNAGSFGGITGCTSNGTSISVTTQSQNDNSTKAASTAYTDLAVSNAVAGVNPAVAVLAASTANITGTYANGTAGVGATFTVTATGAFTLDGISISTIGQRVLLKNQSTGFQNGVYTATVIGAVAVSPVFTRALDYNTPGSINSTGAIPVQSGTVNTTTSWLLTSTVTAIGTDALTYVQFSIAPTTLVTASSPGVGLGHFAGSTQALTSSLLVNADITNSTIDLTAKVTGVLPNANTTAASANTASAIVARDGSGNFTAGTITAALTGTASGNLVSGGALGTPSSGSAANLTGLPSAGLNITTTTCSSQFISALSSGAVGTCSSLTAGEIPNVPVTISTSGAVADPGGAADYQFNNAAGALTFNAPAGAAGLQRCYKQQTGKSGAITIQMASSNTVDVAGVNGSSAGTLVSAGALADAVCLVSDATNHWHAYITSGNWTNN